MNNKCPGSCEQIWPRCEKCDTESYCVRICFDHNFPLKYCKDCCPCEKDDGSEEVMPIVWEDITDQLLGK